MESGALHYFRYEGGWCATQGLGVPGKGLPDPKRVARPGAGHWQVLSSLASLLSLAAEEALREGPPLERPQLGGCPQLFPGVPTTGLPPQLSPGAPLRGLPRTGAVPPLERPSSSGAATRTQAAARPRRPSPSARPPRGWGSAPPYRRRAGPARAAEKRFLARLLGTL